MRHLALTVSIAVLGLGLGSACNEGGFSGATGKKTNAAQPKDDKDDQEQDADEPADGDQPLGQSHSGDATPGGTTKPTTTKPGTVATADTDQAPEQGEDNVLANVDAACSNGGAGPTGILSVFSVPIAPPQQPMATTAPADCRSGLEFNNYGGSFDLAATTADGSRPLKLEVDIASYSAADRMRLIAVGGFGERVILDTCRLRTAGYTDPTGGSKRPPEDSVRYFRPALPKGTKSLRFDWTGAQTPTYIKVVGLCDFSVSGGGAAAIRTVQ